MRSAYPAAIRMLNDPDFRRRLFSGSSAQSLDLHERELKILQELDARIIGAVASGAAGKRIQALDAVLPRTVATLRNHFPAVLDDHLARTQAQPPQDDVLALQTSVAASAQVSTDHRRFLQDLVQLDLAAVSCIDAWQTAGGGEGHVCRSERAVLVDLVGPCQGTIPLGACDPPATYDDLPARAVIVRLGNCVRVTRLEGVAGRLWSLCAETCPLPDLLDKTGPGARPILAAWLAGGALRHVEVTPPR